MYKILIIEDDKNLRNNISDILESEGYKVDCAENGKIGFEQALKNFPDLILCDIMMPEMDGFEVLEKLLKEPETAAIPFIFLTAKVEIENLRDGMKRGADDYLFKPFDINDLLDAIETRLKKMEINNREIKGMQAQIISKIPHELRTPLVMILGYPDLIQDENDINKIKDMVKIIRKSGKILHGKIEKLITYNELVVKKNNQMHESTLINEEIVSHSIKKIAQDLKPTDRTKIEIEPSSIPIKEWQLETIINELIENGLKFSDENRNVILRGFKNNRDYKIRVTDRGRGMSKKEIRSISPFNKYGKDRVAEHGLGLGLTIVKKITELHNAHFTIISEKDKYTTCEVTIPLD